MDTCPNCGCQIEEDMELYLIDDAVIGCGKCVDVVYADGHYYAESLRQAQQDYIDNVMWDRRLDEM